MLLHAVEGREKHRAIHCPFEADLSIEGFARVFGYRRRRGGG
jgi:hypothetical protein